MTEFMNHPFIQTIANKPKWTVSDSTKRPIDIWALIYEHRIIGALAPDENYLCTLPKLQEILPSRTNQTYALLAVEDGFVVLDIEKTCPNTLKQELLELPYLYGETSASGKGYHLVLPLPASIIDYPAALTKPAMKEEHGYYEILLTHYCMFTGKVLPAASGNRDFTEIFNALAAKQTVKTRSDIDVSDERPKNIPDYMLDMIINRLKQTTYKKTPVDFENDLSRYEYAFMGFLYNQLSFILNSFHIKRGLEKHNAVVTDTDKAWIMYEVATDKLPPRAKHEEERDDLPWLLYLARELIAKQPKREEK